MAVLVHIVIGRFRRVHTCLRVAVMLLIPKSYKIINPRTDIFTSMWCSVSIPAERDFPTTARPRLARRLCLPPKYPRRWSLFRNCGSTETTHKSQLIEDGTITFSVIIACESVF